VHSLFKFYKRLYIRKNSLESRSDEVVGCYGTTDLVRKWQSSSDFRVPPSGRPMGARLVCSYYGPSMPSDQIRIRLFGGVNVVEWHTNLFGYNIWMLICVEVSKSHYFNLTFFHIFCNHSKDSLILRVTQTIVSFNSV